MRCPRTRRTIAHFGALGQFRLGSRVGSCGHSSEAHYHVCARVTFGHGDDGSPVARARMPQGGLDAQGRGISDSLLGLQINH